jgi:hypothetical protein
MKTSIVPIVPSSSQPAFPVGIWGSEVWGGGGDFDEMVMEGQKVFHLCQFGVSLIRERQVEGEAEMRVRARTEKLPPGPKVGTGIGGTMEDVTGLEEVMGDEVGGYGILEVLLGESLTRLQ